MQDWGPQGIGYFLGQQLLGIFAVEEWQVHDGSVHYRGALLAKPETALRVLRQRLEPYGFSPLIRSEREVVIIPTPAAVRGDERDRPWVHLLLFVATILTTLFVGALQQGVDPVSHPVQLLAGLPFSLSLLSILGVHEFGHYFTARHYGVKVTLPYFIPAPVGLGTFGAFIKMKSPVTDRKVLFDVGIAGPLAGLCLAIPVLMIGLNLSQIVPSGDRIGVSLGSPLLFTFILEMTLGRIPEGMDVLLHPVAFAGWIGFFVTALNLLPLGQLDGGHISYALLGQRSEKVAMVTALLLILLGIYFWPGWLFWAFLSFVLGFRHPPLMNDVTPLDKGRYLLGLGTLFLLLTLITPSPFMVPEF